MNLSIQLRDSTPTALRIRQRLIQRLRGAGIGNEAVLQAMLATPRHLFVEEALADRAYDDNSLPIGFGQTISQPYVVALMTQALLEQGNRRRVLEIGTGSAYQTAILATLVERVYSVERVARLLERSRERLRLFGHYNVRLRHGDGYHGWSRHCPYDGIVVTAAPPTIPEGLLQQLALGGRLLAPVGPNGSQRLLCVDRTTTGFEKRVLGSVSFVPLLEGVL